MSLTGIISKPSLKGTLAVSGPWRTLFTREGWRIYPFQVGCMVRTDNTNGTCPTHGKGQFAVNNYVLPCRQTFYGDGYILIPDTSRLTRVTAVSSTDDQLTLSPARNLVAGEWLLNLGNDTSAAPLTAPNYDGSTIVLYTDNAGNNTNANDYTLTAQNGEFNTWISDGFEVVDLLVTDPNGVVQFVIALHVAGPGVVV